MLYRKEGGKTVFLWDKEQDVWELNPKGLPYAKIELAKDLKNRFVVRSSLKTERPKTGRKPSEFAKKIVRRTEEEARAAMEEERKRIEKQLQEILGADFVLQVLPAKAALDYSKGISTCIGCGRKGINEKKSHRYCEDCWKKREGPKS